MKYKQQNQTKKFFEADAKNWSIKSELIINSDKMLYLHFVQTTLYWNSIWYCFNSTGYKIGNGSGCKPRSIGGRLEMSTVLILPSD